MNNTKSSITDKKPKDAIKLDSVHQDKTYPEKNRVIKELGNRMLWNFQGRPDRGVVSKELMHIPKNTKVPPDRVSKWNESHMFSTTLLGYKNHVLPEGWYVTNVFGYTIYL